MVEQETRITMLICQRVVDYDPKVNSHIDVCYRCGATVWRAQSSPDTDRILCLICARTELQNNPNAKVGMLTAKQLKDIRDWLRLNRL